MGGNKMHYEAILMNPPYDKNLHLKIVEQSIPMLSDNGTLVNLSPIRWLQDPLAKYKKSSDWYKFKEVRERIEDIVEVPMVDACDMFNAGMPFDLGIYKIRKGSYEAYKNYTNPIVDKVMENELPNVLSVSEDNKIDGWRVRWSKQRPVAGNDGKANAPSNIMSKQYLTHTVWEYVYKDGVGRDGLKWYQHRQKGAGGKKFTDSDTIPTSIPFDSEIEAVNFERSTKTLFYRYLFLVCKSGQSTPADALPFMGDCTNPRTGKKGYEGEWTDEDFRDYFGITDSEWEEIVETMKPYL